MVGSETVRRCPDCNETIFRLDSLTEEQIRTIIQAEIPHADGNYKLYRRQDGTLMISPGICGDFTLLSASKACAPSGCILAILCAVSLLPVTSFQALDRLKILASILLVLWPIVASAMLSRHITSHLRRGQIGFQLGLVLAISGGLLVGAAVGFGLLKSWTVYPILAILSFYINTLVWRRIKREYMQSAVDPKAKYAEIPRPE